MNYTTEREEADDINSKAMKWSHRLIIGVFIFGILWLVNACEKHSYEVYLKTHHVKISYFDYLFTK